MTTAPGGRILAEAGRIRYPGLEARMGTFSDLFIFSSLLALVGEFILHGTPTNDGRMRVVGLQACPAWNGLQYVAAQSRWEGGQLPPRPCNNKQTNS